MELRTLNIKFTPERFDELQRIKGNLTWEEFFIKIIENQLETKKLCEEILNDN